ncbi:MAG: hypothetical protein O3B84_03115 [Chloroflexi bacterium]|nr:hypothetical protein [Chloroflexota bacterium]
MRHRQTPKWADLKLRIKLWGQPELLALVKELHDLSPENRLFLQARLPPGASNADALEAYREKIMNAFYLKSGFPRAKVAMAEARAAIRNYRLATQDITGTVELMVTYLEVGTAFAEEIGDTDEGLHRSLGSVMEEATRLLMEHRAKGLYGQFRERMLALADKADGMGWGYGDDVADTVAALERDA